jgi:CheY-like chemotaxis protein
MPQASTLRVLCVDDQESMLSLHKFAFAQIGVREVTLVTSVREAELMLKNGRFDLIVTDWNMPDIDGLTFFRRLKQDEDLKRLPVIMVTGNADVEHVKTAMAAGLRYFLRKPVKPADLKLRVEAAVGKLT